MNMETREILVARAKTVIIATAAPAGCITRLSDLEPLRRYGRRSCSGVPRGASLLYAYTLQYHPTGVAFPAQIFGALVTEKVRSLGAMLVNVDGEAFMHPLETRDVSAASIIRECQERGKGIPTPDALESGWIRR